MFLPTPRPGLSSSAPGLRLLAFLCLAGCDGDMLDQPTLLGFWNLRCDASGFSEGSAHDVLEVAEDGTGTLRSWSEFDASEWRGRLSEADTHLDIDGSATFSAGSIQFSCDLTGTADLVDADHANV